MTKERINLLNEMIEENERILVGIDDLIVKNPIMYQHKLIRLGLLQLNRAELMELEAK